MRQIKFRAWHGELKEYCEGKTANMFSWIDDGQPITLEQFTGLQDKNGVDIYEGDIIESDCYSGGAWFGRNQPRTKYIVEYNNYKGRFCFKETDRQDNSNSMEVIGNIHLNPELIK
jgi:uncharacterized phage protein (TIGR01671 family)